MVMIAPAEAAEILIDKRQSKQMVDLALLASIVSYFAYGKISPPNGAPPLAARGSNDPCLGIEIRIQGMES